MGTEFRMKTCKHCKKRRRLSNFPKNSHSSDGLYSMCRPCNRKRSRRYYRKAKRYRDPWWTPNPRNRLGLSGREYRLRRVFGISLEEYEKLAVAQGNACAICRNPPKSRKNLDVDHDHKTGKVRGLLCNLCNMGLGSFRDDRNLLHSAIAYLG